MGWEQTRLFADLPHFRKGFHEEMANRKVNNCIAEKFQPLVVGKIDYTAFVDVGGVS